MRDARACIHTHSQHAGMSSPLLEGKMKTDYSLRTVMLTLLHPADAQGNATFRISHQEMIKGIRIGGTGKTLSYLDTLEIPIIENTPDEEDLTEGMSRAMERYPDAGAVLVRRHGVYVWGGSWEQAKTQAECLDYLFEIAVNSGGEEGRDGVLMTCMFGFESLGEDAFGGNAVGGWGCISMNELCEDEFSRKQYEVLYTCGEYHLHHFQLASIVTRLYDPKSPHCPSLQRVYASSPTASGNHPNRFTSTRYLPPPLVPTPPPPTSATSTPSSLKRSICRSAPNPESLRGEI